MGDGFGGATIRFPSDESERISRFWLLVTAGPDTGKSFRSSDERTIVGTHPSAQFVLSDRTVSRFHFEISIEGPRPKLRDLGSSNGTGVDNVSIAEAYLGDRSVIKAGKTELRFGLSSEQIRAPISQVEEFGLLVGRSLGMRRAFAALEKAAASDATVLLEGETGTGKEAAAESIHKLGARRDGPLVVVDCGAVPAHLLESELFGHERGSFTGAVATRTGAFASAEGGTIFLDEIGELPLELQPKLLRVLERREVKRVGANNFEPVDVRVIAATHRNLYAEVNSGGLRADLYYRLAVLRVTLPPLRDRREDLSLLVPRLVAGLRLPRAVRPLFEAPDFLKDLAHHAWPGNVRELRNYLECCAAYGAAMPIDRAGADGDLTPTPGADADADVGSGPFHEQRERYIAAFEKRYLEALVHRMGGNMSLAAKEAGLNRSTLYRLLWRYGLK